MEPIAVSAFLLSDVVLRYVTVALLMVSSVLLLRDAWAVPAARYGAGVGLTVAALLLGTPYPGFELPKVLHVLVRYLDVASIGLVWWFGLALFTDGFRPAAWHWLGMVLLAASSAIFRTEELGFIELNLNPLLICSAILTFGLLAHLIWVVLKGRNDDMIESRRRMRLLFVSGLIIVTLSIVLIERVLGAAYQVEQSYVRVLMIFPLSVWTILWLTRLEPERLAFLPSPVTAERPTPRVPAVDRPLQEALRHSMEQQQLYRQPGLTIRQLADHLSVPEHRLRVLINKGLGYRNFSSFINDYRVEAIKRAMADPVNARLPILTLALEEGFNSLAPFNKAFRERTGQTPTEFKESLLASQNAD